MDLPRRLRSAPGGATVLAALGDEDGVYVVGGAVRDALLDRTPRQLDLVVEGDAVGLARRFGPPTVHDRFGTATVVVDGVEVDFAAARRERYPRPGALPEVQLGATIEQDLERRDFTINAMAVRVRDGALIEHPGARADLDGGVLRVLHDRSFIDDPTRILRLLRYAARLGFEPEPETDALIDPKLFATVSGDRLGRELRLLLEEPEPARQLARHGIGKALLGEGFEPVPLDGSPLARLAACCTRIPPHELAARLDELGFPARERKVVVAAAAHADELRATLPGASDADLWRALRRLPPEAAEVAGARRWLDIVRHRRLAITGDDLLAAGLSGAAVGDGLEKATVAMLDGAAPDRASQLQAALS